MSNMENQKRGRPHKKGVKRDPSGRISRPSRPRNQPEPVFADSDRLEVEQMAAVGLETGVIAESFDLSEHDLRRRFRTELQRGSARRRRELVGLMFAKARAFSPPVMKDLFVRMERVAAEKAMEAEAPAPRLGKKEEAALAAQTAGQGTDWADDLEHGSTAN